MGPVNWNCGKYTESEGLKMRLRELLTVVNSPLMLEINEVVERYDSKNEVPEERMNYDVKTIAATKDGLVIKLGELRKIPTLDELGYSFEVGV